MEERELRITYGMAFKLAGDIVAQQDLSKMTGDEIVEEISNFAESLTHAALGGQEKIVSHYSHLITAPTSSKRSGGYGSSGSSSTRKSTGSSSGGSRGPKNPSAPATEKQVNLATRLFWSKEHDLSIDPDSFEEMTMGEISKVIDQLMDA